MMQPATEAFAAMQYLIWAIEEIDKINDRSAAHHARKALAELRRTLQKADTKQFIKAGIAAISTETANQ